MKWFFTLVTILILSQLIFAKNHLQSEPQKGSLLQIFQDCFDYDYSGWGTQQSSIFLYYLNKYCNMTPNYQVETTEDQVEFISQGIKCSDRIINKDYQGYDYLLKGFLCAKETIESEIRLKNVQQNQQQGTYYDISIDEQSSNDLTFNQGSDNNGQYQIWSNDSAFQSNGTIVDNYSTYQNQPSFPDYNLGGFVEKKIKKKSNNQKRLKISSKLN